jgi:hypothetical protein
MQMLIEVRLAIAVVSGFAAACVAGRTAGDTADSSPASEPARGLSSQGSSGERGINTDGGKQPAGDDRAATMVGGKSEPPGGSDPRVSIDATVQGGAGGGSSSPSSSDAGSPSDTGVASGPSDGGTSDIPGARQWLGRWTGMATYRVAEGPPDLATGLPTLVGKAISIELRVDDYRPNEDSGWTYIDGRISADHCLLSASFTGQIFGGDDLSSVAQPRISLTAVGESDIGQVVLLTLAGQRTSPSGASSASREPFGGTLNLSSMDRRPPCTQSGLPFELSPIERITRSVVDGPR